MLNFLNKNIKIFIVANIYCVNQLNYFVHDYLIILWDSIPESS